MIRSCKRHLMEAGETYFQHLRVALGFSARLVKAGAACALHAFVPALFTTTASRSIKELHSKLATRAALSAAARREAARRSQAHERSDEHRYRIDA